MTKAQVLKIISETASEHSLSREEKFRVFVTVCDKALRAGQITPAQHTRWTHVF